MSFEQNLTEWYQNYLGRAPDQSGWDNYMGQLQGGRNVYEVAHEIQYSKEGRDYAASQDAIRRGHIADAQMHANNRAQRAEHKLAGLESRIGGYEDRIRGFERDIDDYRNRNNQLQQQYTGALGQVQNWTNKANEFQQQASNWENQFNKRTGEWEAARSEAERYRNEAVGRQLQGLRSGSTVGGANARGGPTGTLSSGRSGYRAMDDRAVEIEKNIKAESGALASKGPVVERLVAAQRARSASPQRGSAPPAQSSSYYASRFR